MFARIKRQLQKRKVIKELGSFDEVALWKAIRKGNILMAETLLNSGISADCRDEVGQTGLMIASEMNRIEMVKLLITHKATLDLSNQHNTTALMLVAKAGHTDVARLLLDAGAEVDRRNRDGQTSLVLAIQAGNTGVVRYLLNAKADPNMLDNEEKSVLQYATFSPSLCKILKEYGAKESQTPSDVEKVIEAIPYLGENMGKVLRDINSDNIEQESLIKTQEILKNMLQLLQFKQNPDEMDKAKIEEQLANIDLGVDIMMKLKNIIIDLTGIIITLYQKSQLKETHPQVFLKDLGEVLDSLNLSIQNLEQKAENDFTGEA